MKAVTSLSLNNLPESWGCRLKWISSICSHVKNDPVRRAHSEIRGMVSCWILWRFSSADDLTNNYPFSATLEAEPLIPTYPASHLANALEEEMKWG